MAEGFQPFSATQGSSRVEGKGDFTKHMIRFRHADQMNIERVGDSVPEVILVNSHDGSSSYKLSAGLFRLVCSNGLIVSDSTVGSLTVPHMGDVQQRVIEGSFQIVGQAAKSFKKVEEWQGLTLTAGEQKALAEAAHIVRFGAPDEETGKVDAPITAEMLLRTKRPADRLDQHKMGGVAAPDLWRTFNVIQRTSSRAVRRAGRRRSSTTAAR